MLVVHIAWTPVAGAPIRLVNALNRLTEFKSRLITHSPNCYGARTFQGDLNWQEDKDECLELISKADILHFHHFFDYEDENNMFGINFRQLAAKAKFVVHLHSDKNFIKNYTGADIDKSPYPKLVIPHYPERTFLDVFVVPNILPVNDTLLLPQKNSNVPPKVFFSASSKSSMWEQRWNTKGLPEVCDKFKDLQRRARFEFSVVTDTPHEECLHLKQKSDIVIGDTTSGSYHLTDLEALSQGKPTFTYLDGRSQFMIQNLLKCDDLPFINTRLEEIDAPFLEIIKNEKLRQEIGLFSRQWIEKYYRDEDLINFYIEAYNKLLNGEPLIRQKNLHFSGSKVFLYNDLYDLQWATRQQRFTENYKKNVAQDYTLKEKIFSIKNQYSDNKKYKVVQLFGIKCKFKVSSPPPRCPENILNIAFTLSGGLGDILIGANYVKYIRELIGYENIKIDIFCNRSVASVKSVLKEHDIVDNIYSKSEFEHKKNQYALTGWLSMHYPGYVCKDRKTVEKFAPALIKIIDAYENFVEHNRKIFDINPGCICISNAINIALGKKRIQVPDIDSLLGITEDYKLSPHIENGKETLEKFDLLNRPFITFNRGVDGDNDSPESTKLWSLENYNQTVKKIKEKYPGYTLVQLGVSEEKCKLIEGIDVSLVGKTTLEELKVFLKNAVLHIDGEGGMVHLRKALKGGTSIVMFGPTSERLYGYSSNVNLSAPDACPINCDWISDQWQAKCIRGFKKQPCMENITPQLVLAKVDELLGYTEKIYTTQNQ